MSKPSIITVEGNIGAGKSTLLASMKERYKHRKDIMFIEEPVDIWAQVKQDGKTMLELFYEDQKKYSFAFQILAFTTRLKMMEDAVEYAKKNSINIIVTERSLDADKHIFTKMLHDDGLIEECMYKIYLMMSKDAMSKYMADGILWLITPPEECLERIKKRGRDGEGNIPFDYLDKCDICHREWLGADLGFVSIIEDNQDMEKIDRYLFSE